MSQAMPAASGGFVSRAERSAMRNLVGTQPAIGPGAYEVVRNPETNPAPVPFHTSSERVMALNPTTSAVTPGPGAYGVNGGGPVATGITGPASPFVSGVPRLPTDPDSRARIPIPGPGTYDVGNQWVKGGHRYRSQGRDAAARVSQMLHRRPTAPSVPGRGESYGYEEEPDGTLTLQSSPEKPYSGVGQDKVGPGAYELGGTGPFPRPSGTSWSNSKSGRLYQYGPATPGVGTYNLADGGSRRHGAGLLVSIGGVEVVFGGTTGTSSFVSKAPRPLQKLPLSWKPVCARLHPHASLPDPSPGPGDYNNLTDPVAASTGSPSGSALRSVSPGFGITGPRGIWEMDPTKAKSAPTYWRNPGPGAYEDPRVRKPGTSRRPMAVDGGAGSVDATTPFLSTSLRFGPTDNAVPGPGDYHPDAVTTLEFDIFKKASISRPAGAFGASTGRFAYNKGASSPARLVVPGVLASGEVAEGVTPGPGNYDPRVTSSAKTAVPDLSDFDGTTPLKGDPTRLGPGCYNPERPLGRSRYGNTPIKAAPFGTESNRANMELASKTTPGPGRYIPGDPQAFKPTTIPPPKTGFSAQADRFKSSTTFTPGPGTYQAGADSAFVRKSYNVTYAGTVHV
ncbi:hypothetical protein VOLCADRAFT_107081 [Volvox carteri f. nagariensis]|uniref:Uncharacterized protein n=1 Tax=Volvox carteri f. nagariensis TaxID=3068 RepID=D8UBV5_VOLCA|nr:uncharacterized protein VOLCADRAFT_107081 [Volvox carteri f. nagariensis]EFJ42837.1 hypothetical protein VOLCADRAFT_107081 [Volvox carteri f. nagariensis]|eukprot:XP_002956097.1 hypothetical protein VOLCADRAFT_107081 [Volvox carteri f. nagariensis]